MLWRKPGDCHVLQSASYSAMPAGDSTPLTFAAHHYYFLNNPLRNVLLKMPRVIRNKSEFWNASSHPTYRRHVLSKKSLKKTLKRTVLIFISMYIYIFFFSECGSVPLYIFLDVYVCEYLIFINVYIKKYIWVHLHVNAWERTKPGILKWAKSGQRPNISVQALFAWTVSHFGCLLLTLLIGFCLSKCRWYFRNLNGKNIKMHNREWIGTRFSWSMKSKILCNKTSF